MVCHRSERSGVAALLAGAESAELAERFWSWAGSHSPELAKLAAHQAPDRAPIFATLARLVAGTDDAAGRAAARIVLGRWIHRHRLHTGHLRILGEALAHLLCDKPGGPGAAGGSEWDRAYQRITVDLMRAAWRVGDGPACWSAEVVRRHRPAEGIAILTVRPDRPLPFQPGQAVPVSLPSRPGVWRWYCPANAPRPDGTIDLHVRAVAGGSLSPELVGGRHPGRADGPLPTQLPTRFSSRPRSTRFANERLFAGFANERLSAGLGDERLSAGLVQQPSEGDRLWLGPATGRGLVLGPGLVPGRGSVPGRNQRSNLLLIAGGTGLAPLRALVEQIIDTGPDDREVTLVVGARTVEQCYDAVTLDNWQHEHDWLTVLPAFSDESSSAEPSSVHPLERGTALRVALRHDWPDHDVYLCGPTPMIHDALPRLVVAGLPLARIHLPETYDDAGDGDRSGVTGRGQQCGSRRQQ